MPARWPLLQWTDRALFCRIGIGPRLLSSITTCGEIPDELASGWWQSCKQMMWRSHSVGRAIAVSIVGLFLIVGTSAITARFISLQITPEQVQLDMSSLNTLAQVHGAILATLLAVITFAITIRAQREDDALIPFVACRYHMYFILAIAVAVTAADGVMPAAQSLLPFGSFRILLIFNIAFVPLILLLSLRLVSQVIQDATLSNFENTLPIFKATMREAAVQNAKERALIAQYIDTISSLPLAYDGYASAMLRTKAQEWTVIAFTRQGIAGDVDLFALNRLAAEINKCGSSVVGVLTVRPGDRIDASAMLILADRSTLNSEPNVSVVQPEGSALQKVLVSDEHREAIQRSLNKIFVWRLFER